MTTYFSILLWLVTLGGCASADNKISSIGLSTSLEHDKDFLNNLDLRVEQGLNLEDAVACEFEAPGSYQCFGAGAVTISVANWKQGITDEVQFLVNGNLTSRSGVVRDGLERAFVISSHSEISMIMF